MLSKWGPHVEPQPVENGGTERGQVGWSRCREPEGPGA